MAERYINLVVPLAHKATAMRFRDTAASQQVRSSAVSVLGNRGGDVDSTMKRLGL